MAIRGTKLYYTGSDGRERACICKSSEPTQENRLRLERRDGRVIKVSADKVYKKSRFAK